MTPPLVVLTAEQLEELLVRAVERALSSGPGSPVLSTEQAAEVAGVTPQTILDWVNKGLRGRKLPAGHRGRKRTIRREDLFAFLEGERGAGGDDPVLRSLRSAG